MQRTVIGLAALALSACAHGVPTQASCPAPAQAMTDVPQVMRAMYAALQADDVNAFHGATTKDFFAYDAAQRFDGDALLDLVKGLHAQGVVFDWRVNDPKVEVACNMALVTYVNTGSVTRAGAKRQASWLESATLRRDGERWRIRFFHSTQVPPPANPQ